MGDVGVEVDLLIAHVEVMSLNDKEEGQGRGERERIKNKLLGNIYI